MNRFQTTILVNLTYLNLVYGLADQFTVILSRQYRGVILLSNEVFQHIQEFLVGKINPDFIIVFGSYATGTTHTESDIDIAFFRTGESFTSYELFMFAQELADIIKIEVDLIDLKEASTVFATQIFSTGTVIFSQNENLRMELHMRTYSMYARLNEERQPIIDKIIETGSVYGE